MTLNIVKKILYKENPYAWFYKVLKGNAYYKCATSIGDIYFKIPVSDMGDSAFVEDMESKLLIRWIEFWELKD